MKAYPIAALLVLFATVLAGCDEVCEDVSSSVETRTLNLDNIEEMEVYPNINLTIAQGSVQSVSVTGQGRAIDFLETEVDNGKWRVKFTECLTDYDGMDMTATLPNLNQLTLAGPGNISGTDTLSFSELTIKLVGSGNIDLAVNTNNLRTEILGSGNVTLNGTANNHNIHILGRGDVLAFGLDADDCDVNIVGEGTAEVTVSDDLDVSIGGEGNVYYKGSPDITSNITGEGQIIDAN